MFAMCVNNIKYSVYFSNRRKHNLCSLPILISYLLVFLSLTLLLLFMLESGHIMPYVYMDLTRNVFDFTYKESISEFVFNFQQGSFGCNLFLLLLLSEEFGSFIDVDIEAVSSAANESLRAVLLSRYMTLAR